MGGIACTIAHPIYALASYVSMLRIYPWISVWHVNWSAYALTLTFSLALIVEILTELTASWSTVVKTIHHNKIDERCSSSLICKQYTL